MMLDDLNIATKSAKEYSILMWESDLFLFGIMQTVLIGHQMVHTWMVHEFFLDVFPHPLRVKQ